MTPSEWAINYAIMAAALLVLELYDGAELDAPRVLFALVWPLWFAFIACLFVVAFALAVRDGVTWVWRRLGARRSA